MIEYVIFDVDGTLTDGSIAITDDGTECKVFQAKDGLIVRVLPKLGFTTAIITGRFSEATIIRAKDLHISTIEHGIEDKRDILERYFKENSVNGKNVAYIGDDLNDYMAMRLCGFKACPCDATHEIKAICDYISPFSGGRGAVRDICEHILKKTGKYDDFLVFYGIK